MIQFYKPTKSGNGSSCTFSSNGKDKSMYTSLMKQFSWDNSTGRANFKGNQNNPDAKVNVKFSMTEIAGFINAIEKNSEFKGYHSSERQIIRFDFAPYVKDGHQKGFTYRLQREAKDDSTNKVSFLIGFKPEELVLIREFLLFVLRVVFETDQRSQQENFQQKENFHQKKACRTPIVTLCPAGDPPSKKEC